MPKLNLDNYVFKETSDTTSSGTGCWDTATGSAFQEKVRRVALGAYPSRLYQEEYNHEEKRGEAAMTLPSVPFKIIVYTNPLPAGSGSGKNKKEPEILVEDTVLAPTVNIAMLLLGARMPGVFEDVDPRTICIYIFPTNI